MAVKNYDPASLTLAEHFLQEEPTLSAHHLALHIQDAVETWIEYYRVPKSDIEKDIANATG